MRRPRILCVPNFSEGRRIGTLDALARAVQRVRGVALLDQHADPDHHRSVLTFAGPPGPVAEAAFQAAKVASRLIDLRRHRGGHPRIGATDVIPLVPLGDVSIRRCVTLARALGRRIGRELRIPVFLYEHAASRPEHARLEAIRRGGLEGLGRRMSEDPQWRPDFGPGRLHPSAGATVIGARLPLIAFNVNLASRDLGAAREIAQRIRASGGGLPGVKALGVELGRRRLVQVSMNVTDFQASPLHRVYDAVKGEAAKRGIEIDSSEVVGLVPIEAVAQVAAHYLQLIRFSGDDVLEARLESHLVAPSKKRGDAESIDSFLAAVAAARPTPGSGSVAALVASFAAALGVKACAVTTSKAGRRRERGHDLRARAKRLQTYRARLTRLVEADARAYDEVTGCRRLSDENSTRERRLVRALRGAAEVPLEIASVALRAAEEMRAVASTAKASVASDARAGRDLAIAAGRAALRVAEDNIKNIKKQSVVIKLRGRMRRLRESLVVGRGL